MRKLAALVLVLVVGCASDNSEYAFRIGEDWHPVTVGDGQVSLASGADSVVCQVKAYGWKMLSTSRVKAPRDAWFQRGRLKQKWGWKLLVHNASSETFGVGINVSLMSDHDVRIDRSGFWESARISPSLGGGPIWSDNDPNRVQGGETRLLSGTAWYWVDEHRREGRAHRVEWTIRHYEGSWSARNNLQQMAKGSSQPSN